MHKWLGRQFDQGCNLMLFIVSFLGPVFPSENFATKDDATILGKKKISKLSQLQVYPYLSICPRYLLQERLWEINPSLWKGDQFFKFLAWVLCRRREEERGNRTRSKQQNSNRNKLEVCPKWWWTQTWTPDHYTSLYATGHKIAYRIPCSRKIWSFFQVWKGSESTEKKLVLDKITGVQPVPPSSRDLPYKEYNNLPKMQTKNYTQSESWHSVTFPEPTGDFVMMLATTNRSFIQPATSLCGKASLHCDLSMPGA